MGSVLCEHCTGICCKYLALPLERPETRRDFDDIRWYLMHEGILVFVEDGDWYIQFTTRCRALAPDNRCSVYETRPKICREYTTAECDYQVGEYDYEHLFTTPEELESFARAFLAAPYRKRGHGPRPRARHGFACKNQLRSAG